MIYLIVILHYTAMLRLQAFSFDSFSVVFWGLMVFFKSRQRKNTIKCKYLCYEIQKQSIYYIEAQKQSRCRQSGVLPNWLEHSFSNIKLASEINTAHLTNEESTEKYFHPSRDFLGGEKLPQNKI